MRVLGGVGAMKRDEFLTIKEVAKYLRVDMYTIYRLVTQKKLPAFKIGSQWRYKRSLLERWIKGNLNTTRSN